MLTDVLHGKTNRNRKSCGKTNIARRGICRESILRVSATARGDISAFLQLRNTLLWVGRKLWLQARAVEKVEGGRGDMERRKQDVCLHVCVQTCVCVFVRFFPAAASESRWSNSADKRSIKPTWSLCSAAAASPPLFHLNRPDVGSLCLPVALKIRLMVSRMHTDGHVRIHAHRKTIRV